MASPYSELLEATLSHLEDLAAGGAKWVAVRPESLAALRSPLSQGRSVVTPLSPAAPVSRVLGTKATSSPPVAMPTRPAVPVPFPVPSPPSSSVPSGAAAEITREGLVSSPTTAKEKEMAMQAICDRALVCQKCPHLVRSRTQVVFGVGSLEAALMFVGEAPGVDEDRQGEPFVGPAGQLLTRIIQAMGFARETVYIANILKCRPDTPGAKWGNRPPRPEEMETCKPYLLSQIEIIRPRVLVALGSTAVQGLLGLATTMGAVRGRWHDLRGVPVMPTYHPSYLLRSEDAADKGFSEKRKTWEDMLKVLEKMERPISPKMRGYFLKAPAAGTPG